MYVFKPYFQYQVLNVLWNPNNNKVFMIKVIHSLTWSGCLSSPHLRMECDPQRRRWGLVGGVCVGHGKDPSWRPCCHSWVMSEFSLWVLPRSGCLKEHGTSPFYETPSQKKQKRLQILWHASTGEVESSSPPLQSGMALVTCLLTTGQKRSCGFRQVLWNACSLKRSFWVPSHDVMRSLSHMEKIYAWRCSGQQPQLRLAPSHSSPGDEWRSLQVIPTISYLNLSRHLSLPGQPQTTEQRQVIPVVPWPNSWPVAPVSIIRWLLCHTTKLGGWLEAKTRKRVLIQSLYIITMFHFLTTSTAQILSFSTGKSFIWG